MKLGFLKFLDLKLLAGREFRKGDDPWSKGDVIINRRLARELGFPNPEDAIGAEISGFYAPLKVIGVVENHHQISLHYDHEPIAYILSAWSEFYFIKFNLDESLTPPAQTKQLKQYISEVETNWIRVFPNEPFDYFFLDQAFDQQYASDEQFWKIFGTFSGMAILIACLGLFGLTSFTLQQRAKEIGIRKVLGAGFQDLLLLLVKNYLLIIFLAFIISIPTAWLGLNRWLEHYNFRIELGWWLPVIPFVIVFSIALLTIFTRISKALKLDPVESLRDE
jgi:putative ABC transport system permease protein